MSKSQPHGITVLIIQQMFDSIEKMHTNILIHTDTHSHSHKHKYINIHMNPQTYTHIHTYGYTHTNART